MAKHSIRPIPFSIAAFPSEKRALAAAAKRSKTSLSRFVLAAALKAAKAQMKSRREWNRTA